MSKVDLPSVEGLHSEIGLLLAMLDDVTRDWTNQLGRVSKEAIVWQPRPESHSIGALILHIADVEAFWLHQVGAGERLSEAHNRLFLSEETQQYAGKWPTPPKRPLTWYMEQHRMIRERTREYVRNLNDPEHVGHIGKREFTLRWLLHHVLTHEAYHGGQAVLLTSLYKRAASTQET